MPSISHAELTTAELNEIFRKIAAGERQHGGFLTDFATAFVHADAFNRPLLRQAALDIAAKYQLLEYRHDGDAIKEFPPSE